MALEIKNVHIAVDDTEIVKGVDLGIEPGKIHAIMGPNGSGKSTLANALMGHPRYEIVEGAIVVDGEDVTDASPDQRAKAGLYLSMQYPEEIEGVTITSFLRTAKSALTGEKINPLDFHKMIHAKMKELNMDPDFGKRYLNVGFSGGEKKRAEILQLAVLDPTYAVLDETDSGLDVDALRVVSAGINAFNANKDKGILLITHYSRILQFVKPDVVHIMKDGKIVASGAAELAEQVEREGYESF